MALGHLGQLNGDHYESRMLKFRYKYMLLSTNFLVLHRDFGSSLCNHLSNTHPQFH